MFSHLATPSISIQLNPYQQVMPMQTQVPQKSDIERCGEDVMRGAITLRVEREESCMQCLSCDYRSVTYSSQLGAHKVKRFQPSCISSCFVWPLKRFFCEHTTPMGVTNESTFVEQLEIKLINRYHGFVSVKGITLGTLTLEDPSGLCACCCGAQPKVIIRKAETNEEFTMKANDGIIQMFFERCCGCFIQKKDMLVQKQGQTFKGDYSRSCFQACVNSCCTGNIHYFHKLDMQFYSGFHDFEKVLVYAAFIFLQENTNQCFGCLCCCQ